jgi:hypothetical protein
MLFFGSLWRWLEITQVWGWLAIGGVLKIGFIADLDPNVVHRAILR